ncbi:MAG: hypothetical protein MJZ82_00455 [Paludibacteraceae bacterium]|nr:hypothetical protein [Paludibacteraceae bacterium]
MIINGGTIEQTAAGSICYCIDNNTSAYDAKVIINGGVIRKATGSAIRMFCNSTTKENSIVVNGGEIYGGYAAIWIQLPGSGAQAKKATLEVNGGTLRTNGGYAFYDYTYGDIFDAVHYTLNGGTFEGYVFSYGANIDITGGTYNAAVEIEQSLPSVVSVSDGTFKGGCYCYGDNASTGYITGGTYFVEPEAASIANGYEAVAEQNYWVVKAAN